MLRMGVTYSLAFHLRHILAWYIWENSINSCEIAFSSIYEIAAMMLDIKIEAFVYPWFISCSTSSSHNRTCIEFPSRHQWKISSISFDSHYKLLILLDYLFPIWSRDSLLIHWPVIRSTKKFSIQITVQLKITNTN